MSRRRPGPIDRTAADARSTPGSGHRRVPAVGPDGAKTSGVSTTADGEPARTASYCWASMAWSRTLDRWPTPPVSRARDERRLTLVERASYGRHPGDGRRVHAGSETAAGTGVHPEVRTHLLPRGRHLAALDARPDHRREGPDRHGQHQYQQRHVRGGRLPTDAPQAQHGDEVAPTRREPAERPDRDRVEPQCDEPDGESDRDGRRREERIEPDRACPRPRSR